MSCSPVQIFRGALRVSGVDDNVTGDWDEDEEERGGGERRRKRRLREAL